VIVSDDELEWRANHDIYKLDTSSPLSSSCVVHTDIQNISRQSTRWLDVFCLTFLSTYVCRFSISANLYIFLKLTLRIIECQKITENLPLPFFPLKLPMTIFGNLKKKGKFWAIFDIQMAIFRRVSSEVYISRCFFLKSWRSIYHRLCQSFN